MEPATEYCKFCQERVKCVELTTTGTTVVEVYCNQCGELIRTYRKQYETERVAPAVRDTKRF